MKIATWNVERLKHYKAIDEITAACEKVKADILVLTESDDRIQLNYKYSFHTPTPPDLILPHYKEPLRYKATEHRVSIFTNYTPVRWHTTYDAHTAMCVELETDRGNLLVYGTIIGITGNRSPSFETAIQCQEKDLARLCDYSHLCFCGDFNCSFGDNYYFTNSGREKLRSALSRHGLTVLTASQSACIDHIAISERLLTGASVQIHEWNLDKRLSDHKGISVQILK